MNQDTQQPDRLAEGGLINRKKPLDFSFNGKPLQGFAGDTLASALLANQVRVVGRSFKYHRPRGIFSAGEEEPCALVEIGTGDACIPNSRAPLIALEQDLVANSQHCWPSVNFDIGRVIDYSHAFWPAGFYNKTFKWPSWHTWEGLIRNSAGLGRPLTGPDPDHYEQVNTHCDLLICGSGPAGLAAALTAGRAGARVLLVEQDALFGGMLNWEQVHINGQSGHAWARACVAELQSLDNILLLPHTIVTGSYDHKVTTLLQMGNGGGAWRECFWTVRPKRVLLATGAIEQGLIFPNNDRPGIMLAGAARHYLNRYAVVPGNSIVMLTNNDSAYQTVFDMARQHLPVSTVVELRSDVDNEIRQRLGKLGTELLTGARISATRGTRGIRQVSIKSFEGKRLGHRQCDLLAVSGGWSPRLHLLAHAGGKLQFDPHSQCFLPAFLPEGYAVAGSAAGNKSLADSLLEATRSAGEICNGLGLNRIAIAVPQIDEGIIECGRVGPVVPDTGARRQWIDLAHDVTMGDAELAVREGFVSIEHFKRYTTAGMSVDQGKTANLNALITLGVLTKRNPVEVGTTTFRPPYMPVTLGAVAGRKLGKFYAPMRHLPAHSLHQQLGAHFEDYGWLRPDCYPREGESAHDAVMREALGVRRNVGIFDNSPIGKIDVRGPDAAEFLNRVYINNALTLKTGHARYGLMLNENGVIIDDGVFVRMADDLFLVHTTSGGVARIVSMMEEWLQCEWTGLQVLVDDMTTQWANFTIAGPRAREVLTVLGTDIDISAQALPHMAATTGMVAGLQARIVRVSFSGELSFEVNIPAASATAFLKAALDAGEPFGITPFGVETLMVLRTEKGYLHVGADTDGTSTPDDIGWGAVARKKTTDYIGKRSLMRPANLETGRKQLVGLETLDPQQVIRPGGHLLIGRSGRAPAETEGWITSACYSPNLKRHIALGVLRGGQQRHGEVLSVYDDSDYFQVKVVPPVFYDPYNLRLKD